MQTKEEFSMFSFIINVSVSNTIQKYRLKYLDKSRFEQEQSTRTSDAS